jgi:phage baseplate assembly protein W
MRYARYLVQQFDTLEAIAYRTLGDPTLAPQIAALNRLRWPYISDNPRDRYAPVLVQTQLTAPSLVSGLLPVQSAAGFPDGGYVLVQSTGNPSAQVFYDFLLIRGTARAVGTAQQTLSPGLAGQTTWYGTPLPAGDTVVLDGGMGHIYPTGTQVFGYPSTVNSTSQVVGTGDVLLLPRAAGNAQTLSIRQEELVDVFGTDLALDPNGFLTLTNRDATTVAGAQNLGQALTIRLRTEQGELPLHPAFGNPALAAIGSVVPQLEATVYAGVIQTLVADPRVARVQGVAAQRVGDAITVTLQVLTRDTSTTVSLADLLLTPFSTDVPLLT